MKDTARDELENDIRQAITNDYGGHEVLRRALEYVQNNPSVFLIEQVAVKIEMSLIHDEIDYQETRDTLDKYRDAILIMEKHA